MVGGSAIQYQSAVVLLQGSDSTIRAKSLLRTELHEGFNLGSCNGCFTKTICHVIKLKNKDAEFFSTLSTALISLRSKFIHF